MDEQNKELMESQQDELPEQAEVLDEEPEEAPVKKQNPQLSYTLRIIIGGYIAYLGWELASGIFEGTVVGKELIICGIAAAVFAICGVGLVVWSLWLMMKKP
ncbi:MAG: hypothetical protein E7464_05830 [Ruminococcaceae bacterium]|nr:hypothetical protein [Oscillospiraceae bacterium]